MFRKSCIFVAMKIHAPLLPLAVCLMAGIAVSSWLNSWTTGLVLLACSTALTCLLYRWPRLQTAGIWLCFLLLGMTIGARRQHTLDVDWPKERSVLEVVVAEEPIEKERWRALNVLTTDGKQKLRLQIQRDTDSENITIGDGLLIDTHINKVRAWTRDSLKKGQRGHFDYRRYMQCHGFTGEGFVHSYQWQRQSASLHHLSVTQRLRLRFLCWRHLLLERYRQWGVSDEAYGILAAMTLGEKTHISQSTREIFREVGASHILALSGLHLMIIYGVISLLVSWRRIRMLSQVLIILAIWAFSFLSGLSPSVVRSASMITLYALLSVGYRNKMSVNTLAFVAIVMLIINPLSLYDFGFQLSFMAVLSIVLINPLLYDLIPLHIQQHHPLLNWLWGLTAVSLSAQIGTAPLVAYYFGYFSTVFLLTNYIAIPLATIILYLTPLLLAVSWWPWGAEMMASVLSCLVVAMNRILGWIASLPYSNIDGIWPSAIQVFLMYVALAGIYIAVSLRFPTARQNG